METKINNIKKHTESPNYKGYKELPSTLFNFFRHNAKRRNIEFNIDIKTAYEIYVNQNKKCYYTDIDLFLDAKNCNASLDRIDSDIGYEKDNLMWVYKPINAMKRDFSLSYFVELCCLISDNNKNK